MLKKFFTTFFLFFIINIVYSFDFFELENDTIIQKKYDGRFTLGTTNFKLMYGYPYPYSTSHFVVSINNQYASNRPYLKGTTYLTGTLKSIERNGSFYAEIEYEFNGVTFIQKLIPVDRYFEEVNLKNKNFAQYYHVEYTFENRAKDKRLIGMMMLFDTQIADNDACVMQTCKFSNIRSGKSLLEKFISLFSFGSQKKERTYEGEEVPEVVLVFRSEKRQKDITGAFVLSQRKATKPDEVLIGRWPFYKNVRWGFGNPNDKNMEYEDSALLLRFKPKETKPFEKQYFSTYYGVLDLDTLKMLPAKPAKEIGTDFKIEPDTIYEGETAELSWKTKNAMKADVIISSIRGKLKNEGKEIMQPLKSQTYTLKLILQGKEIEMQELTLTVLPKKSKPNNINPLPKKENNISQNNKKNNELPVKLKNDKLYDGRFTFGTNNKKLTFGYPFPYSTSHFILTINGKNASNYDGLGKEFNYLEGKLTTINNKNSLKTQVEYEFEGITIIQKLIPCDAKLKEINSNTFANYYNIEYTFKNTTNQEKELNFALMLDIMSGTEDNAIIKNNEIKIPLNTKILGEDIPEKLSIYAENEENIFSELIINQEKVTKPDAIFIGIWQHLNTIAHQPNPIQKIYTNDCAVHLSWQKRKINQKESKTFNILFGNKSLQLSALHHQKKPSTINNVFFELNKFDLNKESISILDKILDRKDYAYLVIEGFTDKTGTASQNYELSQQRVEAVIAYLTKNGIDATKILVKSHGQFFAGKKADNQERRVSIMVFD
ncbi:MAG: OmpA family protein [Bacteroidetes bacterium]|nr:MAG: OmpA family protein [Bacteroidota bacterium]